MAVTGSLDHTVALWNTSGLEVHALGLTDEDVRLLAILMVFFTFSSFPGSICF